MRDSKDSPWTDYSHEVKLVQSKTLRVLLISLSALFLLVGFIGLFLPLLPTTPFVLLAAACYARSSVPFYNWLMNHRWFGRALRQWVEHRSISKKSKVLALTLLWATMLPTLVWVVPLMAVKILLAGIGLAVSLFLLTRPNSSDS